MERHAAHGDVVAICFAAFGQRDVERGGGLNRVVVKEFVKIAHAVKKQGAGVAFLERVILRHDWRVPVGDEIFCRLRGCFQRCFTHNKGIRRRPGKMKNAV
jgi:hypothetical protein